MTDEQIIFLLHLGVCAFLFVMGIPLWREKVAPNRWYGFRTPSSMRDERIWYSVNRVTGCWMMVTALIAVPAIVATFLVGLTADLGRPHQYGGYSDRYHLHDSAGIYVAWPAQAGTVE